MQKLRRLTALALAYKWYLLVLIVIAIGIIAYLRSGADEVAENNTTRSVEVARVADLMAGTDSLSVVATIESTSEARISPETSGKVTRVRAALGQSVGAGQVLVELENSSQRAALTQADGALDAAKASAGGAQGSAVSTLLSAYGAVDTAIEDAVGQIFTNPESSQGGFKVSSRDTASLAEMEAARGRMSEIVLRESAQVANVSDATAPQELPVVEGELREVRAYLDTVLKVLNAAVPRDDVTATTIGAYVTDVTAARSAVTASLSAVISARASVENQSEGLSSSAAAVKQAEGAYQAALANFEKTLVRSPISGTLNNFEVKLGDTLTQGQQFAVVSNNGALEAVAQVSESERTRISVGAEARIEGGIMGTVTRVAPALDPVSRRIEVRIGLPRDAADKLTNGQSVRVSLAGASTGDVSGPITIPLTALKMNADASSVFTLQEGTLRSLPVTTGRLMGERIEVTEGLTLESEIVVDARGFKEGDAVSMK